MDFASTIITGFVQIVIAAGSVLLVALAALVIVRAMPIVMPVLIRFAVTLGDAVGKVMAVAFGFLIQAVPLLWRVGVVAVVIGCVLQGASDTFTAYGSDLPALVLAGLLILAVTLAGFEGGSFGSLLACGVCARAIGALAIVGDAVFRSLLIVGALAVAIAHNQLRPGDKNGNPEGQQRVYGLHQDRPDRLHDDQDGRSGDVDDAAGDQDLRRAGGVRDGSRPACLG